MLSYPVYGLRTSTTKIIVDIAHGFAAVVGAQYIAPGGQFTDLPILFSWSNNVNYTDTGSRDANPLWVFEGKALMLSLAIKVATTDRTANHYGTR
jgi:hypothetical protein